MIYLNQEKKEPFYQQLYQQLRHEIINGTRQEGEILPGSRSMARTLGISRNTVDHAYDQLLMEGYIEPKRGIGYLIQAVPKLTAAGQAVRSSRTMRDGVDGRTVQAGSRIMQDGGRTAQSSGTMQKEMAAAEIVYDLTNSSHTSDLFPKKQWRKYTLESLDRLEKESRLSIHLDKQGEWYLRHHLELYLERIRGVHCSEEQIIITSGLQQSLSIICQLLPGEETEILMEEPGYHKAAAVFANAGRRIRTIPVDENGLVTEKLPSDVSGGAVYTTPSHQFPTGAILPVGRRYELLKWAAEHHFFIIEDDFDSEQRYYARPVPSLQSIDQTDHVIYLGTFSKALSPSVRMGYMILPARLMEQYRTLFQNYNSTTPLLNQYIIGRLIETGEYDRHVRRLNRIFRKRLECFQTEFQSMHGKVKISGNGSGQYFLLQFSGEATQEMLIREALQYGVQVYSTMQFWQDKVDCPPDTLFLGFSKIDLEDIPDCVMRLQKAWNPWI